MQKYLLDTHVLIWFLSNSSKLSKPVFKLLKNKENVLNVSIVSLWEITIKQKLNKLDFDFSIDAITDEININDIVILDLKTKHLATLNNNSLYHRDPFDRMIISQAQTENLTIITKDKNFSLYNVDILW